MLEEQPPMPGFCTANQRRDIVLDEARVNTIRDELGMPQQALQESNVGRHALDSETIEIEGKRLIVKKFIGYKETVHEFNTQWAKIDLPTEESKVFHISQSHLRVELGQFLRREQQLPLIAAVRAHLG